MTRSLRGLATCVLRLVTAGAATAAPSLLFIGNSATCGVGSAVPDDRPTTVTDLKHDGIGGAPALVKSFPQQAGPDRAVHVESRGGKKGINPIVIVLIVLVLGAAAAGAWFGGLIPH